MEDCGVRFPDGIGGVGGTGSRAGGGRGLMLSPLGLERMLCSMDGFCRNEGMGGVFWAGLRGEGRRLSSPVLGLLPPSGYPGLLGPANSPGGLLKLGFEDCGVGPLLPSSEGPEGRSPGLRGGGPGDFGGNCRCSGGGAGRCTAGSCISSRPPNLAAALPSAVASCGLPFVRLFNSFTLKPVRRGKSPLVYLL